MMSFQEILSALGQVAFPIVGCVALFYEMHQNNLRREQEITQLREILTDNTNTLRQLVEYLKEER